MTATVTATFSDVAHSNTALEALGDAGFAEGTGLRSTRRPRPTIEVRGSIPAVELAMNILEAHDPETLVHDCQTWPLRGYEVGSSAHTQQPRTAAEQWRARRADAAASPEAWAAARHAVRFGGRPAGRDGFGGSTGVRRGSSMRDRVVAVRDDQGPHTLTNRG